MKGITPLITADRIEEGVAFWRDRMGMEVLATVPHDDAMGFAMLGLGDLQLMYQSASSVAADLDASASSDAGLATELGRGTSTLFIEVEEIDGLLPKLEGLEVVVPRRETFYGMDEIFVRAPCGTLVGFAARTGTEA